MAQTHNAASLLNPTHEILVAVDHLRLPWARIIKLLVIHFDITHQALKILSLSHINILSILTSGLNWSFLCKFFGRSVRNYFSKPSKRVCIKFFCETAQTNNGNCLRETDNAYALLIMSISMFFHAVALTMTMFLYVAQRYSFTVV